MAQQRAFQLMTSSLMRVMTGAYVQFRNAFRAQGVQSTLPGLMTTFFIFKEKLK